ncbi:MAG: hypothetical protein KC466_10545, partial [Myxococcales bacterium]|nr:hypothetical protein [Myxococcales bacterium]
EDRDNSRDVLEPEARADAPMIDPQPEDPRAEDGGAPIRDQPFPRPSPKYRWEGQADTPIGWNRFPSDWIWSPHDQWMMSYWNVYGGVVHGIIGPYSKWGYGNGRFDLAGFPGNAQMKNQFDRGWKAKELAVTFTRGGLFGGISEADIAFNPAFEWTLDNAYGARADTTAWSFEQTMLHELGHGCGIKHPWETQNVWWDSVMNYPPKEYRMPILFADDTEAVRDAYYYLASHDGLISAYETFDTPGGKNPTYKPFGPLLAQVNRKGSLSFKGNFKIENAGNGTFHDIRVEVYLCPERFGTNDCRYLKQVKYPDFMPPFAMWVFDGNSLGTVPIPEDFPLGKRYIALNLIISGEDDYLPNNASWVNEDQAVTVKPAASLSCDQSGGGSPDRGIWILATPLAALAIRRRAVYSASRRGPSPYSAYRASGRKRAPAISP